jgi:hypothetical protein
MSDGPIVALVIVNLAFTLACFYLLLEKRLEKTENKRRK